MFSTKDIRLAASCVERADDITAEALHSLSPSLQSRLKAEEPAAKDELPSTLHPSFLQSFVQSLT